MKTKINGILTLLLVFMVQMTFAQERTISGVVSDEMGPVADISVKVKGTTRGTVTDFDGNYSVKAKTGDVLVFTHVSYATVTKTVGASSKIDVMVKETGESLDEVVIVAMGIKRKPDEITTSSQNLKNEELTKASAGDIASALTGKVSGLRISQTSSGVSGNSSIVLRGLRSFSGSNSALIVIDGVPSSKAMFDNLDPELVESVNVLKGANGAALYGSEGLNGAIIVTTKKGNGKGKAFRVNFKSSTDFETIAYLPERQTRYGQGWAEGGEFRHLVYENGAWGPEFDGAIVPVGLPLEDGTYRMMPYETLGSDNIKDFFKTGTTFHNVVSISGGSAEEYASFSVANTKREFIIQNDTSNSTSFAVSAGKKFDKLTIGAKIQYVKKKLEYAGGGLYGDLLQTATNIDINQFSDPNNATHWNGYFLSPFWKRENIRNFNNTSRMNSGVDLGYEVNDHITISSRLNHYSSNGDRTNYTNAYTDPDYIDALSGYTRTLQSAYGASVSKFGKSYAQIMASLNYDLTSSIKFDTNFGYVMTDVKSVYTSVSGNDLTILDFYNIANISGTPSTGDSKSSLRNQALFADFTFGFKNYLFLNLTGRNDWLSQLNKDNRSLFYPSAGISFIPTKAFENFGGEILNKMKLAVSYVSVGNANSVGYAAINDTYVHPENSFYGNFPFDGGLNSFIPSSSVTDNNLQPEFIKSTEFNLTMEFLHSRIRFDASAYMGTTSNQISQINTSYTSGLTNNRINIGEADTKGMELDLGLTVLKKYKGITWDVDMSYSTDKMTVTKVSDQSDSVNLQSNSIAGTFAEVGEQFPLIKGTDYQRDDQGRVIVDGNGTPLINSEFQKLGYATPAYVLGLRSSLKFKNFNLGFVADYRGGKDYVNVSFLKRQLAWSGYLVESAENGRQGFIFPNSVVETSSGSGVYVENTSTPTASAGPASFLNYYSNTYADTGSNLAVNASAFKVREISLSYSLPKNLLGKTGLDDITITAQSRNPFTILSKENRGYVDPEASNSGSARLSGLSFVSNLPSTKTYGFSLKLTF